MGDFPHTKGAPGNLRKANLLHLAPLLPFWVLMDRFLSFLPPVLCTHWVFHWGCSHQLIHIKHLVLVSLNLNIVTEKQVSILWKGASGSYRKEWSLKADYISVQPFWQSKQPRKILMETSLFFSEHFCNMTREHSMWISLVFVLLLKFLSTSIP